jgi:hypothetical protein
MDQSGINRGLTGLIKKGAEALSKKKKPIKQIYKHCKGYCKECSPKIKALCKEYIAVLPAAGEKRGKLG